MIWVNFCTRFLGLLSAGQIEDAKNMLHGFQIKSSFLQVSNIIIKKTAYNNKDIFIECLIDKSNFVVIFEINKNIGKITNIQYYQSGD
tara:strand:- start:4497 stop:4760 length:264 start_codon:yes stop_codon:yes gene_type:complete